MQKTVLFVDDVPAVTAALKRRLRDEPYRILEASSAREALDIVAREPVDVVVTDERMPDMTGSDLLAHLYRTSPHVIGMILSGQATLDSAIRAINDGHVYRFLTKPCDPIDLARHIRRALGEENVRPPGRESASAHGGPPEHPETSDTGGRAAGNADGTVVID